MANRLETNQIRVSQCLKLFNVIKYDREAENRPTIESLSRHV